VAKAIEAAVRSNAGLLSGQLATPGEDGAASDDE
jgi:hypothetical protein